MARWQLDRREAVCQVWFCRWCSSLWLVVRYPDRCPEVLGPLGDGCALCCRQFRPWWPPVPDEPEKSAERPAAHPTDRDERPTLTKDGAAFTADLLDDNPEQALAEHLAELITEPAWRSIRESLPIDHCRVFGALADGLDELRADIQRGAAKTVAVCAEMVAVPRFLADVVGEIAGRAVQAKLEPLHATAQGIRMFGAAVCVSEGALDRCHCALGLEYYLTRDVLESLLKERVDETEAAIDQGLNEVGYHQPRLGPGQRHGESERELGPRALVRDRSGSADLEVGL